MKFCNNPSTSCSICRTINDLLFTFTKYISVSVRTLIKGNGYNSRGVNNVKLVLSLLKWSTLNEKKNAPSRHKGFPLRIARLSNGKCQNLPLVDITENLPSVFSPFGY